MWPLIFERAREQNLNTVQTYLFWNSSLLFVLISFLKFCELIQDAETLVKFQSGQIINMFRQLRRRFRPMLWDWLREKREDIGRLEPCTRMGLWRKKSNYINFDFKFFSPMVNPWKMLGGFSLLPKFAFFTDANIAKNHFSYVQKGFYWIFLRIPFSAM